MPADEPKSEHRVEVIWAGGRSERTTLTATGKSGGAGEIFSIDDRPGFVAKIYHANTSQEHLARYRHKIQWMIDHQPALPQVPAEYHDVVQLAWPEALILRQSRFAGFAMRKIAFDRTLELDYLLNRRQAANEGFDADYGKLMTVSFNLASLIDCLHAKRIAIVDLKPMNVKVYKTSLYVSILDCDGFHIATDEFRSDAPQVTPEYLAPEFQDKTVAQPEAQDRFALATIIFRLLNYGIHPFSGVAADRAALSPRAGGPHQAGSVPLRKVARQPRAQGPGERARGLPRRPAGAVRPGLFIRAAMQDRALRSGSTRCRSTPASKAAQCRLLQQGSPAIRRQTLPDLRARGADPGRRGAPPQLPCAPAGRARPHSEAMCARPCGTRTLRRSRPPWRRRS